MESATLREQAKVRITEAHKLETETTKRVNLLLKVASQFEKAADKVERIEKSLYLTDTTTSKRGRPFGSKNKVAGPRMKLRDVVMNILTAHKDGIKLKALTEAVQNAGYKTKAKKFESVVWQTLNKMAKEEKTVVANKHLYSLVAA